jgi:hypothetical protein
MATTPLGGGAGSLASGQDLAQNAVAQPDHRRHHHNGYCAAVTLSQNFNGQAIPRGSWLLFTSVTQFPGNPSGIRVEMRDSKIVLYDGYKKNKITIPDMVETIGPARVSRHFDGKGNKFFNKFPGGTWVMKAPSNTGGNNFLTDAVYRVPRAIQGNLQNVTWSAKFYSRDYIQQMHWQWGATQYTHLSGNYKRLGVKALDSNKYPPYNNDPAGTPERYKAFWVQNGGGTGGPQYTGAGGPTANVTPCY